MNEIFKIHQKEELSGINCISARELYKRLGVKTQFTKWWQRNLTAGFKENIDYLTVSQKRLTVKGNKTEYLEAFISLDMAKQICMLQKTDIGKQFRQYFIECEKRLKNSSGLLTDSKEKELNALQGVREKAETVEIFKQIFLRYDDLEIRVIKIDSFIYFQLSEIEIILKREIKYKGYYFSTFTPYVKYFKLKGDRGSGKRFISLEDMVICLSECSCDFLTWIKQAFNYRLNIKEQQPELIFNASLYKEDNDFQGLFLEWQKKQYDKILEVLRKYPGLSFRSLNELKTLLQADKNEKFYDDIFDFCNRQGLNIKMLFDILCFAFSADSIL